MDRERDRRPCEGRLPLHEWLAAHTTRCRQAGATAARLHEAHRPAPFELLRRMLDVGERDGFEGVLEAWGAHGRRTDHASALVPGPGYDAVVVDLDPGAQHVRAAESVTSTQLLDRAPERADVIRRG